MPISERICWEILRSCEANDVSFKSLGRDDPSNSHSIKHALPLHEIERSLVLHHKKQEIEDSLYFLEKRGYLVKHGYLNFTVVALQLSPSALEVLHHGVFPADEQRAFRDSLMDLKQPSLYGLKINLGEAWRRLKKWRG